MGESILFKRNAMRLRLAIALVVSVIVIGIVLVDGLTLNYSGQVVPSLVNGSSSPVAAIGGAQSVQWSCPGGSGSGGPAPVSILITSSRSAVVQAQVRVVSNAGLERFTTVNVPADGRASFVLSTLMNGPFLGAYVIVNGGGVGVSEIDQGFTGWSVSPCAAHGADQWYFADGSTAGGDRLYMELLNPGATTSVVNLSFSSSQSGTGASASVNQSGAGASASGSTLAPSSYQGIVIPPFGLVVEDLGHHVVSKVPVAAVVKATTGVVVAAELQVGATGGSSIPNDGMALMLGSVSPAKRWWFPVAWDQPGSVDAFHVFNPGNSTVRYKAIFKFSGGSVPSYQSSLSPHAISTLVAQDIPGLPTAIPYQLEIRVVHGGSGVVASSSLAAPAAAAPNPLFGMAAPISRGYRCWVVPVLPSPATGISAIGISDLGRKAAHVVVRALYSIPGHTIPGSTSGDHFRTSGSSHTAGSSSHAAAYPPDLSLGGSVCSLSPASVTSTSSRHGRSTVAGGTSRKRSRSSRTPNPHYGYTTIADQTVTLSEPFALGGSSMPSLTGATALVVSANQPVAVEADAMPFGTIGAEVNPAFSL